MILPAVVLLALLVGLAVEHLGNDHSALPSFTPARPPAFEAMRVPEAEGVLRGRVLAAPEGGGQPVADASVYVRSGGIPHWTFTDAEGSFELTRLPAFLADEENTAVVLAWGHPPSSFEVAFGDQERELVLPAQPPPLPTLPEVERAPIEGRVLGARAAWGSSDGYEIVFSPAVPANVLQGPVERRIASDASGAFTVEDLALGAYRVSVLPTWARGGTWPDLVAEVSRDLDHTRDTTSLELELSAGAVEGPIWDTSPKAVEGALVLLVDADQPTRIWPPAVSDEGGRFRIRALPPGRYLLTARAGEGSSEEIRVEVRPGEVTRLELPALPMRSDP